MQQVAGHRLGDHGAGLGVGADHTGDRLVPRGVEGLTERRVARDAGALQHLEELALDQLDAPYDALGAAGRARRPEGAV